jgi:pullulanase/glycogen debranching enzyme
VHGPYAPGRGHRCDAAKLLLDPYGKAVAGQVRWHEALFSRPSGAAAVDVTGRSVMVLRAAGDPASRAVPGPATA